MNALQRAFAVAPDPTRPFDTLGAVLSAAGLILVVMGVLAADNDLALMAVLLAVGAILLAGTITFLVTGLAAAVGRRPSQVRNALFAICVFVALIAIPLDSAAVFSISQKSGSRLMLVWWPLIVMLRFAGG